MMIILIPSALAIYGGESWTYHFDYCDELRVNITANQTIDIGEYTIHNKCSNQSENYFICNCTNDFDFNISFKTNTVNNYKIFFNYDYSKEVTEEQTDEGNGGGGGSSGGRSEPLIVHMSLEELDDFISEKGITLKFARGSSFSFIDKEGQEHTITITAIFTDRVILTITSDTVTMELYTDKTKLFKNIKITLLDTRYGRATLNFKKLIESIEEVTEETIEEVKEIEPIDEEPPIISDEELPITEEPKSKTLLIIVVIVVAILLTVLIRIYMIKKKVIQ